MLLNETYQNVNFSWWYRRGLPHGWALDEQCGIWILDHLSRIVDVTMPTRWFRWVVLRQLWSKCVTGSKLLHHGVLG